MITTIQVYFCLSKQMHKSIRSVTDVVFTCIPHDLLDRDSLETAWSLPRFYFRVYAHSLAYVQDAARRGGERILARTKQPEPVDPSQSCQMAEQLQPIRQGDNVTSAANPSGTRRVKQSLYPISRQTMTSVIGESMKSISASVVTVIQKTLAR